MNATANATPQDLAGSEELVILLSDEGTPIGQAPKATVHTTDTPLHAAFSCYVTNEQGKLLVTRRALSKLTWPGVWTNSFCGHPAPGEDVPSAITRRAEQELGLAISNIEVAVPDFRYRAVDASGIVEHEICPVYVATTVAEPQPNPQEIAQYTWVEPADLVAAAKATPFAFSPWMVLQLEALAQLNPVFALKNNE